MALNSLKQKLANFAEKTYSSQTLTFHDIVGIFLPILFDQFCVSLLNVLNSSMVSASGAAAVSAVSMVDSLNYFLTNFFISMATGGTVVVAQYRGRGDSKKCGEAAAQAVNISVIIAVTLASFFILFSHQTLNFLFGKAEQAILNNANIYLIGSCMSFPLYAVFQAVIGALRGLGDTKASMVVSILMNLLYVAFNLITINFLGLGVLGVVISLISSRGIGAACGLIYLLKSRPDLNIRFASFFKLNSNLLKSIMFIGIPAATEQVFFHSGKILTQTFVVELGTASITAHAIANSLGPMTQIAGQAVTLAIITIVGQCIGAKRPDEAKRYIKIMNRTSIALLVVNGILMLPLVPWLVSLYKPEQQVAHMVIITISFFTLGNMTLWSNSFVIPSGLRAGGDAKFTSITALLSMWLVRVVLGYVLGIMLRMDVYGIWLAMVLEWSVRGTIFWVRSRGDKWYRHKVIQ